MKSGVLWPVQAVGGGLGRAHIERGIKRDECRRRKNLRRRKDRDEGRRRYEDPRRDKASRWKIRPRSPPLPFIPSSAVSSFSVTPCSVTPRCSRWIALCPSAHARPRGGHENKSWRLRGSGDGETEALPAPAHRTLWYRRYRGLPFTLHLFYFIFRGINVFGALPVG